MTHVQKRKYPNKVCDICKNVFTPATYNQVRCSATCAKAAQKKKLADKKAATLAKGGPKAVECARYKQALEDIAAYSCYPSVREMARDALDLSKPMRPSTPETYIGGSEEEYQESKGGSK